MSMRMEAMPSQEKEKNISEATDNIIKKAEEMIKQRFHKEGIDKMEYHNWEHTEGMIEKVETILEEIRKVDDSLVSEKDIELGKIAAALHDVWQDYEEVEQEYAKEDSEFKGRKIVKRMRAVEGDKQVSPAANEKKSAEEAEAAMRQESVFDDEDIDKVKKAIVAGTVAGFHPDKGVYQPELHAEGKEEEISPLTRALALADIGAAGMVGPEKFAQEGRDLFREENIDIRDAIRGGIENISEEDKKFYKERMLGWAGFQIFFAQKRQENLVQELKGLPENVQKHLKKEVFNKFNESIRASAERLEKLKNMNFEKLCEEMGYDV